MIATALPEMDTPETLTMDRACPALPQPTDRIPIDTLEDCHMQIAEGVANRRRAWALVYQAYKEKGYAQPDPDGLWYGLHDALPDTRTIIVNHRGRDVASLTLVFDSPIRLPADGLYADELNQLRAAGRRPCEIISLVNRETDRRAAIEILKHMFKLAYLAATRQEAATDFIITVNPHHVGYYERKLLFTVAGPERTYGKVSGAPAVMLRLDLETAPEAYREKYGQEPGSFYRFFVNEYTEWLWMNFLSQARYWLTDSEFREWFTERRPLIQEAPEMAQAHLQYHYSA